MSVITDFLESNPISASIATGLKMVDTVIDRVIPDPKAANEYKLKVLELQQQGEFQEAENQKQINLGQIEVNKVEAASSSLFVSGWRPAIGWVCAVSLACYFIPQFVMAVILWVRLCYLKGELLPYPVSINDVITLTSGMLGIAGIRMAEKFKGVARG